MATPTLINMPEPPSNPDTPTEAPGTPNSTTTSLSALSTTAIKDGHRGSSFPHAHYHTPSSNTLEAERADRISRLAGLERVSTARPPNPNNNSFGAGGVQAGGAGGQIPGYFDQNGNPVYTTKMSTVGSASATASTTGRTTTWASTSQVGTADYETEREERGEDEMSMDETSNFRDIDERDRYSARDGEGDEDMDGMSDDTSLVGFGEGAGSTVSGPTYSRKEALAGQGGVRSLFGGGSGVGGHENSRREGLGSGSGSGSGLGEAERIVRDRLDAGEKQGNAALGSPDEAGNLGKFYFEEKK